MYVVGGADLTQALATFNDALLLLARITEVLVGSIVEPESWQYEVCQSRLCQSRIQANISTNVQNYTAVHIHVINCTCRRHMILTNKKQEI